MCNFISIQNSHLVAAQGNHPMPLRTGYERMIAHRMDDNYAYTARQQGTVEQKNDELVVIRYEDDSVDRIAIGRRYGRDSSLTIPHDLICDLNKGDVVNEGDVVVYHSGFFDRDPLSPKQVLFKESRLAKCAIVENAHTYEDASAISEDFAQQLSTQLTEVRTIFVQFDQLVRNVVEIGDEVDVETILCTIEDPVSAHQSELDEDAIETLRLMRTNTPTAKTQGVVESIRVFYRGDIDNMSDSIAQLAQASDQRMQQRANQLGEKPVTGEISANVNVDKQSLDQNTAAIQVYITHTLGIGVGDKGVFGNQLKSVFSHVMSGVNETASGTPIDALFGYKSISDRIVLSPEIMGTTNTLLRVMSQRIAQAYFGSGEQQ